MTIERPTWKLGEKLLLASRPAAEVDIAAVRDEALSHLQGYERMEEPARIESAAVDYAAECMKTALLDLALKAREGSAALGRTGWSAVVAQEAHDEILLLLTHPVQRGAWSLSMRFDPILRPECGEELDRLKSRLKEELRASGLSEREIFMRGILKRSGTGTLPIENAIAEFEKNRENYLPVGAGHDLEAALGHAIRIPTQGWNAFHFEGRNGPGVPGAPFGVEDAGGPDILKDPETRRGWSRGLCVKLRPVPFWSREDRMLTSSNGRDGVMPHLLMEILSDLVRENGLLPRVAEREAEISGTPWICYGDGNAPALQELGHALIHRAGGLFDASVTAGIRDYSARIAALDVSNHLEKWADLAPRLVEAGHWERDHAFEANDGRDQAWAECDRDQLTLFTETQNGDYRLDIHLEDDAVSRVEAWKRVGGAVLRPVGRFEMTGTGLSPRYDDAPAIGYDIRNVRDMNGIILSLSSVACVFDEEMRRGADPQP